MSRERMRIYEPYRVGVSKRRWNGRGMEDCDLPTGYPGWCVYLDDYDKQGRGGDLSSEAVVELRTWLHDTLGMSEEEMDENIYIWGVTFEHKDQAFLCFLHYKEGARHVQA